ncbi:hypothetical protein JP75_07140 [Devosia riboflavina]|uniref:CENP-V/GFA domain-containing protein n=1 Tax=Devosia riboflavina TaxID=46914 RepID=A0A087M4L9_9HYPH|nr:hypothetical protein [Devosia riboflavina]KFL31822.1 hypothetical protein JP75_07140 [Devosia riboflavina]
MTQSTRLNCSCGRFEMVVTGEPFITTECHCNSCREAGGRMEKLPLARPMLEENGGTRFVLYRKDRAEITKGKELLRGYRLSDSAPTRRVVATCCNSPVFLEFKGGHWLSLYSSLWPEGQAPEPEIRTVTGDRGADVVLDDTVPAGTWQTMGFYGKLLTAWIAMGFKVPNIDIKDEAVI